MMTFLRLKSLLTGRYAKIVVSSLVLLSTVFISRHLLFFNSEKVEESFQKVEHKKNKQPCVYTNLRKDRSGAKIQDMIRAWAYAQNQSMHYAGAVGGKSFQRDKEFMDLLDYIHLPFPVLTEEPKDDDDSTCRRMHGKEYRRIENLVENTDLSPLQNRQNITKRVSQNNNSTNTIVVHVRRGDVGEETGVYWYRFAPNAYYLDQIDVALKQLPNARVIVHSEVQTTEPFDLFRQRGHDLKLSVPLVQVWQDILSADYVIMSRSAFSFVPAMLNSAGTILYTPFWLKPHYTWKPCTNALTAIADPKDVQQSAAIQETPNIQTRNTPCGDHDKTPTLMHAHHCTFVDNDHDKSAGADDELPDAYSAQMLFSCWRWFLAHNAQTCVLWNPATNRPLSNWANDLLHAMGCFVVSSPSKCTAIGTWSPPVTAATDQQWAILSSDASILRTSLLLRHRMMDRPSRSIGLLWNGDSSKQRVQVIQKQHANSTTSRRTATTTLPMEKALARTTTTTPLVGDDLKSSLFFDANIDAFVMNGNKSVADQAGWIHSYKVIVTTHGPFTSANVVFANPCTALITLGRADEYPLEEFYAPLFRTLGVIPIFWFEGQRGDNNNNNHTKTLEHLHSMQATDDEPIQIPLQDLKAAVQAAMKAHVECKTSS